MDYDSEDVMSKLLTITAQAQVASFVNWARTQPDHKVVDELYDFLNEVVKQAYDVGKAHGRAEFYNEMHTVN